MKENERYYNEELKKRYIKEKEKQLSISTYYIDNHFRNSAEQEYELDKDLSEWTTYEIIEYYKLLNLTSYESLACLNSTFSQYTQFCLENNLVRDNQNHYLECTKEVLLGCVNKAILDRQIIDRETILKWVNELPNPKDQFILLSLFEYGKSKDFEEIVQVRQEDYNGNQLKLINRTVNISYKLQDVIEDCISETTYYSMTGKKNRTVSLVDYGYIIKSYPNQDIYASERQKGRNIYITCRRIFEYLGVDKWMNPNAITESGKLHMIKERAKALNMTPMEYIYSDNIREVELQFGFTMVRSVYAKKYEEYLV